MFVKLWLSVILFAFFVSAKNTTYCNYNGKDFIQALQVGCPNIKHQAHERIHCFGCNINLCVCQIPLPIVLE